MTPRQKGLLELDDVRVAEVGVVDELALDILKGKRFFFFGRVEVEMVRVSRLSITHQTLPPFIFSFSPFTLFSLPFSLSTGRLTLPILSPRGRNLIATCLPVALFRASWTKPKAPLARSFTFMYFSWSARGSLPMPAGAISE